MAVRGAGGVVAKSIVGTEVRPWSPGPYVPTHLWVQSSVSPPDVDHSRDSFQLGLPWAGDEGPQSLG